MVWEGERVGGVGWRVVWGGRWIDGRGWVTMRAAGRPDQSGHAAGCPGRWTVTPESGWPVRGGSIPAAAWATASGPEASTGVPRLPHTRASTSRPGACIRPDAQTGLWEIGPRPPLGGPRARATGPPDGWAVARGVALSGGVGLAQRSTAGARLAVCTLPPLCRAEELA